MNELIDTRPHYIYVLKCPLTGEIRYVGQTVSQLSKRLREHIGDKADCYRNRWIQSLIREGLRPLIEQIDVVEYPDSWQEREIMWIQRHWDMGCKLTNTSIGGEGAYGCVRSPETRAKMSASRIGYKHTESAKARMSESSMGKSATDETRAILSRLNSKPVNQYTMDWTFIKTWESVKVAGETLGIKRGGISNCCNNKPSYISAGGFRWAFAE